VTRRLLAAGLLGVAAFVAATAAGVRPLGAAGGREVRASREQTALALPARIEQRPGRPAEARAPAVGPPAALLGLTPGALLLTPPEVRRLVSVPPTGRRWMSCHAGTRSARGPPWPLVPFSK
jgi:hypothetical protein